MLAGEPPFGGGTAQAVLGRIIAGAPVSPTERRPSLPPNVDAAIRKALEKVPADRFTDARVFLAALRDPAFRHGEAARPASASAGPWKVIAAGTSLLSVALLAVLAWSRGGAPPVAETVRFEVGVPDELDIASGGGVGLAGDGGGGLAWGDDGYLYVTREDGDVWRVPEDGGAVEGIGGAGDERGWSWLDGLPGGRGLLFTLDRGDPETDSVALLVVILLVAAS